MSHVFCPNILKSMPSPLPWHLLTDSWLVPLFKLHSQVQLGLAKGEVYHYLIDSIVEAISFVDDYNMIPSFLYCLFNDIHYQDVDLGGDLTHRGKLA